MTPPGEGRHPTCSPPGGLLLAPPVVVVTPYEMTEAPDYDWDAVADSVEYPDMAWRARVEGSVAATVRVTPAGRAASVEVRGLVGRGLSGDGGDGWGLADMLPGAAREGLERARYAARYEARPAHPGDAEVNVLVVFRSGLLPPCSPPL